MKFFFAAIISLIFFACGTAREKEMKDDEALTTAEEDSTLAAEFETMFKTVEAKVIYVPFVNKAGKLIEGAGDYFLVYDNREWFIKFSKSSVLREDVAGLKDQTTKFRVTEMEGLWDTDDPNIQSRIGKYVIVHEILQ